jgi:dolichol-phosphate mannosyltransferase
VKANRRVVIVIPMRNERLSIQPLFDRFAAAAQEWRDPYRIIVVDGNSSDGTPDQVRGFMGRLPIEVVELEEDGGLGGALEAGLQRALTEADVVVTMDGDDSHDPRTIPALLARLDEGFDVVVASRFAPGGEEVGVAAHRKVLSHAASALLRLLFPVGTVRDYSSGFRAYRAEALRSIARQGGIVSETGFACMLDLLLRLRARGSRAAEVPLVLRYDRKPSESKMDVPRTVVRYLILIVRNGRTAWPWGRLKEGTAVR